MPRARLINVLFVLGTTIFFFPSAIVLLSAVLFFLGFTTSGATYAISLLASLLVCFVLATRLMPELSLQQTFCLLLLLILTILISVLIAGTFYDVTYDGQIYHQYAIDKLAHGWNPWREKVNDIWVDHYAKSSWIPAAALNRLMPQIEFTKAFNWAFIFGSFMLASATIASFPKIKLFEALTIGFLAAFNPVSLYQSLSFYVDGQLASLLVALAATLGLFLIQPQKWLILLPFTCIVALLANLKFTGLVYAVIVIVTFSSYLFVLSLQRTVRRAEVYRFGAIALFTLILSLFVMGYNPYVTNILTQGHPFYPLAGKGAIDIITPNQPILLQGKSSIQQLLISIFAKPGNYLPELHKTEQINLQIPFLPDSESLQTFQFSDPRIGGFGPFFNVLFLLGIVLSCILLTARIPHRQVLIAAIGILWTTVLANPAAWWARYVPQLWLFPLLPTIFAFSSTSEYRFQKTARILAKAILAISLVNILLVGKIYLSYNLQATQEINQSMAQLQHAEQPLLLKQNYLFWHAPLIRLRQQKIDYRLVNDATLPCAQPVAIPHSGVTYCPSSELPESKVE